MTSEEHRLMLFMFTKQLEVIKALIEALKSKGILEADDLTAYLTFVESQREMSRELLASAIKQYTAYAKSLGIETGFPE